MISTEIRTSTTDRNSAELEGESQLLLSGETALVAAAGELVGARGITRVSLSEIARHAGVSRQWLHHLYPRIEDLYLEIFRRAHRDATSDLSTPRRSSGAHELLVDMGNGVSAISLAGAVIGLHALGESSGILARCVDTLNHRWFLRPLVQSGVDESHATMAVTTILAVSYSSRIAIERNSMTPEAAAIMRNAVIVSMDFVPATRRLARVS